MQVIVGMLAYGNGWDSDWYDPIMFGGLFLVVVCNTLLSRYTDVVWHRKVRPPRLPLPIAFEAILHPIPDLSPPFVVFLPLLRCGLGLVVSYRPCCTRGV